MNEAPWGSSANERIPLEPLEPRKSTRKKWFLYSFGKQADARVISQPGRAVGQVGDRRHDVGRLTGKRRVPELFLVPRPARVRGFEELVADPPAAIAAFDEIDPACAVAAIGVVIAGEQVAELIERQLLRVAQAGGKDLELGAVGVAAQDRAGIRHGERFAVNGCHVEAAVADAEIEPAVGPELEAVQVVAQKPDVNAVAVMKKFR